MDDIDFNINSYKTEELLNFFNVTVSSSETDLVKAYKERFTEAEKIYDRSKRVTFETFLNDAFDIVRTKLMKEPPLLKLPHKSNANDLPSKSTFEKCLLTIDSNFRNNKETSSTTDFVIDIPTIFDRVVELELVASEIPLTSYNFSASKNNNEFYIYLYDDNDEQTEVYTITIPDGIWYSTELVDFINEIFSQGSLAYLVIEVSEQSGCTMVRFKTEQELLELDLTSSTRPFTSYKIDNVVTEVSFEKTCLYVFGFLETDINIIIKSDSTYVYGTTTYSGVMRSSSIFGITFDDYYYIYVNDFVNNAMSHQIIGIQDKGYLGNNIIGRVEINTSAFNRNIGNTSFVIRKYTGQVRLRKLHIKILDKDGEVLDNGPSNTVLLFRITSEQYSKKYQQIL